MSFQKSQSEAITVAVQMIICIPHMVHYHGLSLSELTELTISVFVCVCVCLGYPAGM